MATFADTIISNSLPLWALKRRKRMDRFGDKELASATRSWLF